MDVRSQNNTQQPAAAPAAQVRTPRQVQKSGPGRFLWPLVALVAIVVLAVGAYLWHQSQQPSAPDGSKYQAVFMTNGQVYFGKLASVGGKYTELTNVYYLQVQQPVQPSSGSQNSKNSQVSLTKLGNELHGPTDKMNISSEQVLFWEDLKDDSTVMKAIRQYENK